MEELVRKKVNIKNKTIEMNRMKGMKGLRKGKGKDREKRRKEKGFILFILFMKGSLRKYS